MIECHVFYYRALHKSVALDSCLLSEFNFHVRDQHGETLAVATHFIVDKLDSLLAKEHIGNGERRSSLASSSFFSPLPFSLPLDYICLSIFLPLDFLRIQTHTHTPHSLFASPLTLEI
ncbi:hypothetical protein RIF29_39453 [Crotalaria pallida]|uniref:Uncharacterized protein n=1 Tax=Crotalaria pallida TaxID=3830 RepID=A0AAN9E492_CROPI